MTALQQNILDRKIEFMRKALKEIENIVAAGEKKYLLDHFTQSVLERQIERLIESAVDAAAHILKNKFKVSPTTYRDTFLEMGRQNVIDSKLAEALAPSAGLRNVIVHMYDEVDPKLVFAGSKNAIKHFPAYIQALLKFKP